MILKMGVRVHTRSSFPFSHLLPWSPALRSLPCYAFSVEPSRVEQCTKKLCSSLGRTVFRGSPPTQLQSISFLPFTAIHVSLQFYT